MSYKNLKDGDRIKLVRIDDHKYYGDYKSQIQIGSIGYYAKMGAGEEYYFILNERGEFYSSSFGGNLMGRLDEWVLFKNEYGCKHNCDPCLEKCEFWEGV